MMLEKDYKRIASDNEAVFKAVLTDLKKNRAERPMGNFVPSDLDLEGSVEDLYQRHSVGNRMGKFTICNFTREEDDKAYISFKDVAIMSGGGAVLEYQIKADNSVEYQNAVTLFRS